MDPTNDDATAQMVDLVLAKLCFGEPLKVTIIPAVIRGDGYPGMAMINVDGWPAIPCTNDVAQLFIVWLQAHAGTLYRDGLGAYRVGTVLVQEGGRIITTITFERFGI